MKRVLFNEYWPASWKYSYQFDLQEVYGHVTSRGYAFAYRCRRDETLRLTTANLPIGSRILDVAAAQGNFSLTLAEMGYQVTWNDLREELAGYVQLKYERGKIDYVPGNILDLTFEQSFDAVLLTEIIEHVAHPDELLRKAGKLVRPGGHIVMTTPNGRYVRNKLPKFSECPHPEVYEAAQFKPDADGHIFLLHPDEIAALAENAGLIVSDVTLFTNPLSHGHLKTEWFLPLLPSELVRIVEHASRLLPRAFKERVLAQMAVRFRRPVTNS